MLTTEASAKERVSVQTEDQIGSNAADSEASEQMTELEPQLTVGTQTSFHILKNPESS